MKIKETKFKKLHRKSFVKGAPGYIASGAAEKYIAVLNKWSEPRALFEAWFQLATIDKHNLDVESVLNSLSRGCDPFLPALNGFLDVCKRASVDVIVYPKNQKPRPFRVEANGGCYTPASKESPIKRRLDESDAEFWERWTDHRVGCFSMMVHDWFERAGTTAAEFYEQMCESGFEFDAARTAFLWVRPMDEAKRLAQSKPEAVEITPESEPLPNSTPTFDVAVELAQIKEMLGRMLTLNTNGVPLTGPGTAFGAGPVGGAFHVFEIEVAGKDEKGIVA